MDSPNLELSPESIADFADDNYVAPVETPGASAPIPGEPSGNSPAPSEPPAPPTNQGTISPYWEKLQKDVSAVIPDYKIPEVVKTRKKEDGSDLTMDEEFNLFREELLRFTEDPIGDDPFLISYLEAKQSENFNVIDWIAKQAKNYQFATAPARELVLEAFRITNEKEKKNWTEDNIKSFVDGLNPIDLELKADAIRNAYRQNLSVSVENQKVINREKYIKHVKAKSEENLQIANDVVAEMRKINSLGGVPHGEAEINEFLPVYQKLVTVNPETGNAYALDLLMDNQNLYKAIYLLYATDKNLISNFKEDFKAEILDKLSVSKTTNRGGAANIAIEMSSEDYL